MSKTGNPFTQKHDLLLRNRSTNYRISNKDNPETDIKRTDRLPNETILENIDRTQTSHNRQPPTSQPDHSTYPYNNLQSTSKGSQDPEHSLLPIPLQRFIFRRVVTSAIIQPFASTETHHWSGKGTRYKLSWEIKTSNPTTNYIPHTSPGGIQMMTPHLNNPTQKILGQNT